MWKTPVISCDVIPVYSLTDKKDMPRYQCEAIDAMGHSHRERVEAGSEQQAVELLKGRGLTCLEIVNTPDTEVEAPRDSVSPNTRVQSEQILSFYEQLAFLIQSGIPIYLAIKMLLESIQDSTLRRLLGAVLFDLSEGTPLSQALQHYPMSFHKLHTNLIAVGEKSGNLEGALLHLVELIREQHDIRSRVVKAAAYPVFLSSLCIALVIGLLLFVFPKFETIFESFEVKLPAMTEFFLVMSRSLRNQVAGIFTLIGAVVFGGSFFLFSEKTSEQRDRLFLKIPIVREIFISQFQALFSKTLSSLLRSGIPLLEALTICQNTIRGKYKYLFFELLIQTVREGDPMSKAVENSPLMPEMARQLLIVGENTGQVDRMLENVFIFYKKRYLDFLMRLTAVLQPILMFFAAALIAAVAISLFVPLFKLGANMRGGS